MTEEYIRTFDKKIIGIIETDEKGNQTARAFPGRQILGYYKKDRNVTTDFYGRVLTNGNTVISLIYKTVK